MKEKITDRILQVLQYKGISKYKFSKDLGFSRGFLDKSRDISTEKYAKILDYFPEINPDWLLTGEGDMLRSAVREGGSERLALLEKEKELLQYELELKNKEITLNQALLSMQDQKIKDLETRVATLQTELQACEKRKNKVR